MAGKVDNPCVLCQHISPIQFTHTIRNNLNTTLCDQWIGGGGDSVPVHCNPPTCSYLTSSFGAHQESHSWDPVETEADLVASIPAACKTIHNKQVSLEMWARTQCIAAMPAMKPVVTNLTGACEFKIPLTNCFLVSPNKPLQSCSYWIKGIQGLEIRTYRLQHVNPWWTDCRFLKFCTKCN
jgi:hypothetical protein